MTAFYNEIDDYAARWLENLIHAGHIAPGVVDRRSIRNLEPDYVARFTQCHFFAGIGVWSHALRLAGVPDDRPLWTGSCPCQPFSAAGKREGDQDERHLWPAWHRLIRECRPPVVLGEQVAGGDGLAWLDLVLPDLEDDHYAVAAANLCAASVGAPHIRQRLFFVALDDAERKRRDASRNRHHGRHDGLVVGPTGADGLVADADGLRRDGRPCGSQKGGRQLWEPEPIARSAASVAGLVGDALDSRLEGHAGHGDGARGRPEPAGSASEAGVPCGAVGNADGEREGAQRGVLEGAHAERARGAGFWDACDWLPCRDGKARPVEPGTFPLAHGAPARVGRLRAFGNAIVAPLAAEFIGVACAQA